MKNVVATSFLLLTCSGLFRAAWAESAPKIVETAPTVPPPKSPPASPETTSGLSVYQLDLTLEDQDAKAMKLDHFRGSPVLIAMFYASCPSACPLLLHDLQDIESALGNEARSQLRVIVISLDGTADTARVLKEKAESLGLDQSRWKLVRGSDHDIRTLAAVLGIMYRKLDDGSINHTSAITLLDGDGVIAARLEGLRQEPQPILDPLRRLINSAEATHPEVEKSSPNHKPR